MPKLEQRITRLERTAPPTTTTPASAARVWKWCVSEGWPAPKPRPEELFAEWLDWVPDETLALMTGEPITRHPMSRPSREAEARRIRIEERIREES
jgi:hypothetical protein